jgi:hypothetical protein
MEYRVSAARWSNELNGKLGATIVPKERFLVIDLLVRNHDRIDRPVPPFLLVDSDGKTYKVTDASKDATGIVNEKDSLRPRQAVTGRIAFDVPRNGTYRLQVYDGFDQKKAVLIDIAPREQLPDALTAGNKTAKSKKESRSLADSANESPGQTWEQYLNHCGVKAQKANQARTEKVFREEYKGKTVSWFGVVHSVSENLLSGFTVGVSMSPTESEFGSSDITLSVPGSFKDAIVDLNKGNTIRFTGRLTGQGGVFLDHQVELMKLK